MSRYSPLKRVGDSAGDGEDEKEDGQAAKKTKLSNAFGSSSSTNGTALSASGSSLLRPSFLKPSKLEANATNMFKSVHTSDETKTTTEVSTAPSSHFLSLTTAGGKLEPSASSSTTVGTCSVGQSGTAAAVAGAGSAVGQSGAAAPQASRDGDKVDGGKKDEPPSSEKSENGERANTSSAAVAPSGYTFGQDLQSRVVESSIPAAAVVATVASTNGSSKSPEKKEKEAGGESSQSPVPLLASSASGSSTTTVQLQPTGSQPITGEENERNVIQMHAKLFQYDSSLNNWRERGRGVLKLNDDTTPGANQPSSRVVMRTHATFTVILNTSLFAEQVAEMASHNTLKLSAILDGGALGLFLVKGSPNDVERLSSLIASRIAKIKASKPPKENDKKVAEVSKEEAKKNKESSSESSKKSCEVNSEKSADEKL